MEAPMPQATISHRLNGNTVSLQCMGKQWSSNDTNWLGYDAIVRLPGEGKAT